MYNKFLGARNFEKDAERLLTELTSVELPPGSTSGGFGKILTIHHDDGGVEVFDVTSAGFDLALAAAEAGDAVWLPPFASIGDAHTVPTGVGVQAYGKKANLTGPITLSWGAFLNSVYIVNTDSSAGEIIGVIMPSSGGRAYLNDCSIIVENTGAGDAIGVDFGSLDNWVWACNIQATANSGDAYGVICRDGGSPIVRLSALWGGSTSGSGYGGYCSDGSLYVRGGDAYGSTARFGSA